jgi:hypothetical protein
LRQFITVVTALGLIATLLTVPASASARGGYPGAVSAADGGTLIVAYRKGTDTATAAAAEAAVGGHRVHSLKSGVRSSMSDMARARPRSPSCARTPTSDTRSTSPITGYWIWRGAAAGGEAQHVQVGTARSYTDLTTTAGIKAFYVVTAVNAVGESPWSNEVGATPTK